MQLTVVDSDMAQLGYAALSEEHPPDEMVEYVTEAERRGVAYAMVSDHYHPWTTEQGESPFIWSVLGAIGQQTSEIPVGTAVTAPIIRIHPAIVAQAAATVACQLPDRFVLGVGTGENLNEHIIGERWPPHDVRLDMLEEAIEIIRLLWEGGTKTYRGDHYTVENARVFTLPDDPPLIAVAASGERTAAAAGHYGDRLITTAPDPDVIERFARGNVIDEVTAYGQTHVCYAEDDDEALETALETWPNAAMSGELGQDLPTPAHFEQAGELVEKEDIAESVVCGSDADEFIDTIEEFVNNGFEYVHLHNIGPHQEDFLEFYTEEVTPSF